MVKAVLTAICLALALSLAPQERTLLPHQVVVSPVQSQRVSTIRSAEILSAELMYRSSLRLEDYSNYRLSRVQLGAP